MRRGAARVWDWPNRVRFVGGRFANGLAPCGTGGMGDREYWFGRAAALGPMPPTRFFPPVPALRPSGKCCAGQISKVCPFEMCEIWNHFAKPGGRPDANRRTVHREFSRHQNRACPVWTAHGICGSQQLRQDHHDRGTRAFVRSRSHGAALDGARFLRWRPAAGR
jgi:hypothetical protein